MGVTGGGSVGERDRGFPADYNIAIFYLLTRNDNAMAIHHIHWVDIFDELSICTSEVKDLIYNVSS